jgi:hypothetical protein
VSKLKFQLKMFWSKPKSPQTWSFVPENCGERHILSLNPEKLLTGKQLWFILLLVMQPCMESTPGFESGASSIFNSSGRQCLSVGQPLFSR